MLFKTYSNAIFIISRVQYNLNKDKFAYFSEDKMKISNFVKLPTKKNIVSEISVFVESRPIKKRTIYIYYNKCYIKMNIIYNACVNFAINSQFQMIYDTQFFTC